MGEVSGQGKLLDTHMEMFNQPSDLQVCSRRARSRLETCSWYIIATLVLISYLSLVKAALFDREEIKTE